jgi:pyruvate dehydrogenase E2 component (dihydrolipoamide acetyltransferase)
MPSELKLTKLKEGVDRYEVTEILVSPGQKVEQGDPLLVVNADKSSMDVASPVAGTVVQVRVKVGDEIKVGDLYCVIEAAKGAPAEQPAPAPVAHKEARAAVPVSTGPRGTDHRIESHEEPAPTDARTARQGAPAAPAGRVGANKGPDGADLILAGPGTRWLARKLGVDLRQLSGTGPNGRITEDDVKNAYGGGGSVPLAAPLAGAGVPVAVPPLPRFEDFGPVTREPLTRVRKLTAQKMSLSWSLIPHVTQHDLADITDLEAFRKQQEARGPKLTVTAFALKACAIALKQFPTFNATLDLAGGQLVLKKYYNIGVAVDTKLGLLVPVIRDVDKKGVVELAQELLDTADKARQNKADMTGGSFTITNLGGIGGTAFTPIINYPEVAILGMSRSRLTPVVREGQVVPRLLLPLSLSYDHRVIDGADAARFTRRIAEMLENPWMMVLHA